MRFKIHERLTKNVSLHIWLKLHELGILCMLGKMHGKTLGSKGRMRHLKDGCLAYSVGAYSVCFAKASLSPLEMNRWHTLYGHPLYIWQNARFSSRAWEPGQLEGGDCHVAGMRHPKYGCGI